eukprot:scaffold19260_cov66-Phaeocystis_antarctica.AAC.7
MPLIAGKTRAEIVEELNKKLRDCESENLCIPRIVWMFWDFGTMPAICKACYEELKKQNGNWAILLLDLDMYEHLLLHVDSMKRMDPVPHSPAQLREWLEDPKNELTPAQIKDYIVHTVSTCFGGVALDASIISLKGLEEWVRLEEDLVQGFGAPRAPKQEVMESFAFAVPQDCKVMQVAFKRFHEDFNAQGCLKAAFEQLLKDDLASKKIPRSFLTQDDSGQHQSYFWHMIMLHLVKHENEENKKQFRIIEAKGTKGPYAFWNAVQSSKRYDSLQYRRLEWLLTSTKEELLQKLGTGCGGAAASSASDMFEPVLIKLTSRDRRYMREQNMLWRCKGHLPEMLQKHQHIIASLDDGGQASDIFAEQWKVGVEMSERIRLCLEGEATVASDDRWAHIKEKYSKVDFVWCTPEQNTLYEQTLQRVTKRDPMEFSRKDTTTEDRQTNAKYKCRVLKYNKHSGVENRKFTRDCIGLGVPDKMLPVGTDNADKERWAKDAIGVTTATYGDLRRHNAFCQFRSKAHMEKGTLFVIIADECHYNALKNGPHDRLINDPQLAELENVVVVLVSATPYSVLTADSRVPERYWVPSSAPAPSPSPSPLAAPAPVPAGAPVPGLSSSPAPAPVGAGSAGEYIVELRRDGSTIVQHPGDNPLTPELEQTLQKQDELNVFRWRPGHAGMTAGSVLDEQQWKEAEELLNEYGHPTGADNGRVTYRSLDQFFDLKKGHISACDFFEHLVGDKTERLTASKDVGKLLAVDYIVAFIAYAHENGIGRFSGEEDAAKQNTLNDVLLELVPDDSTKPALLTQKSAPFVSVNNSDSHVLLLYLERASKAMNVKVSLPKEQQMDSAGGRQLLRKAMLRLLTSQPIQSNETFKIVQGLLCPTVDPAAEMLMQVIDR